MSETCPRCQCCSMRNGECVGPCEPCGHHVPCPECEHEARRRRKLGDIVEGFQDALKAFDRNWA